MKDEDWVFTVGVSADRQKFLLINVKTRQQTEMSRAGAEDLFITLGKQLNVPFDPNDPENRRATFKVIARSAKESSDG